MKSPTISIITPVYKAEQYLDKCISTILSQTFKDWELILIDDGSPDSSGKICDDYANKDSRICVIHKENGGVSAARQVGLEEAKGEYLIHVDPDDWVEPTMLEELYNKAIVTNADVVICDYFVDSSGKSSLVKQQPSSLEPAVILKELFQQLHGSCCNKLIKRVCYNKYNIRFPEGINYCEDLLTWVQLFSHNEVIVAYLNKAFYHYCLNDGSITRNYTRNTYQMRLLFLNNLKLYLVNENAQKILPKVSFNIFTEGVVFNVLSSEEIQEGLDIYRLQISELKSLRWKLGFLCLRWNCYSLAHKLIHY